MTSTVQSTVSTCLFDVHISRRVGSQLARTLDVKRSNVGGIELDQAVFLSYVNCEV